jgi:hypothetical protein
MKMTIPLFCIVLAFLSVTVSPQARATCQDACLSNNNTVQGDDALISLTTGTDNTAMGFQALNANTTGFSNTAIGFNTLYSNANAYVNTAVGERALYSNTAGSFNTAVGGDALLGNTSGTANTAVGIGALADNTSGSSNVAIGDSALLSNAEGGGNTAVGAFALNNNTTGGGNIGIDGGGALTTGSYNIDIGNIGVSGESNTIRIGAEPLQTATFIAGIRNTPLANGAAVAVGITSDGQLGVRASSARFKEAIKPMDKASEAILDLKPVTFRYKKALDPKGAPQFGLVAEDVAKVAPDLVVTDSQGKPFTVRYEEVNAMLLNEFLKEHSKVEQLEATVAQQRKDFEAAVTELKGQIQKVSAQLAVTKPAPQTVLNNR